MRCTQVVGFQGPEPIFCAKPAVLQINEDYTCEEHAPELTQVNNIVWNPKIEGNKCHK